MKRFYQWIACVLLALWLPCTAHCQLETLGWLEAGECCIENSLEASHSEKPAPDCAQCPGCLTMESGSYFAKKHLSPVVPLDLVLARIALLPEPALLHIPPSSPVAFAFSPPELSQTWQFLARTSLPPRAP